MMSFEESKMERRNPAFIDKTQTHRFAVNEAWPTAQL